ncbi:MAG: single-stranded DNA-binding protein [Ruminococcus sp.]|nr:single-stranded DNA-binding protein [Ruminococcus sp.]
MNRVIITGRLTADPELRQTQGGISSCRFTVAVNRKFKDKTTGSYEADFLPCTAWRQSAEFVSRYFHKGDMIAIEGTLRTGSYTDRNHSDVTHYTTEIMVDSVEFCGGKREGGQTAPQGAPSAQPDAAQPAQEAPAMDLSDFEDILSDGDVPF